jgi:starvation-inducible DNA-binding protein
MASTNEYTVPGLSLTKGRGVADELQHRLHALNDLHLTLKHAHWNVTGPNFIAVHEMLDPQIDLVRGYADEIAERIATLGASPIGTPGALVKDRTWEDYKVGRGNTLEHLAAIDSVYTGVVEDHRKAIAEIGEVDPITEDILIGQTAELEMFLWFVRAHLDTRDSVG